MNFRNKFALFSGKPSFEDKLFVGKPNIPDRKKFLKRVNTILDNKWLTNDGPMVKEFENMICQYLGVRNSIAICNATIALEIAIKSLGMKGEVIVPSFTFVATAHSLQWQGITPVFCDISFENHCIDTKKIEKLITSRTTGIIGVHIWGIPCEIDVLKKIAIKHNLKLMFDAAHAFGSQYKGQYIGNFGELEVFSFHATKFLNSFEGGVITTNNDELADKLRLMRNFGFKGFDNVIYLGTNGKMTEVCAAMGITSLESISLLIKKNKANYLLYVKYLENIPGIELINYSETEKRNYQYIIIEVNEKLFGVSRDILMKILHSENIIARRYFYPGCHNMEPYKSDIIYSSSSLVRTIKVSNRILLLPAGNEIDEVKIKKVCNIIKNVQIHAEVLQN
jgi:dTDP-4-amino-4,6-dideoxygalactose transaminase